MSFLKARLHRISVLDWSRRPRAPGPTPRGVPGREVRNPQDVVVDHREVESSGRKVSRQNGSEAAALEKREMFPSHSRQLRLQEAKFMTLDNRLQFFF